MSRKKAQKPESRLLYRTLNTSQPSPGEDYTDVRSETVPGRSLTPSEIIDRFTQGLGVPENAGYYFDNEEIPDPYGLTRLEYHEWMVDFLDEFARRQAEEAKDPGTWTKPGPTEIDPAQAQSNSARPGAPDQNQTWKDGTPVTKTSPTPPLGEE